jgi:hypothetical protein
MGHRYFFIQPIDLLIRAYVRRWLRRESRESPADGLLLCDMRWLETFRSRMKAKQRRCRRPASETDQLLSESLSVRAPLVRSLRQPPLNPSSTPRLGKPELKSFGNRGAIVRRLSFAQTALLAGLARASVETALEIAVGWRTRIEGAQFPSVEREGFETTWPKSLERPWI